MRELGFANGSGRMRNANVNANGAANTAANSAASNSASNAASTAADSLERTDAATWLPRCEADMRALLDQLPTAAYACDADGLITYFNHAATRLWGRVPGLNSGRDRYCGSFKLYTVDGEPVAHDQCWMARALREDRGFNAKEIVIEQPGGGRVSALAHVNPYHDDAGRVVGAVNVLVDISERKRAEDTLRATDRAKDRFLAMLAHELRNPLAPMRVAVELLQRKASADPDAMVAVIERQLTAVTRLVDDLMDVARIRRNQFALSAAPVPVAQVMRTALETAMPLMTAAGHTVELGLPPDDVVVNADAGRLAQVFANLLHNAAKYTPPGGRVTFTARCVDASVEVTVRDTGLGITPELLPRVFELFMQDERTGDPARRGLGIGLALVKQLVEVHGGTVRAHSAGPGLGSEFLVVLRVHERGRERGRESGHEVASGDSAGRTSDTTPRGDAAPSADAGGGSRSGDAPAPQRILVVDDNHDAADGLAMLLGLQGDEVRVAYDGTRALAVANEFEPSVVILDIGLPDMDGYEAVRRMRAEPWGARAIAIALTGWTDVRDQDAAAEAGFDHYFVKPARPGELEACWRRPPDAPTGAAMAQGQRILVVDDQQHVADSIASVLRYLGAEVDVAYDGRAALERARAMMPSVAFVDLDMPGLSGYEVVKALRAMPQLADLQVIAVSGWGDNLRPEDMRSAGFNHLLTKPVGISALEDVLALVSR